MRRSNLLKFIGLVLFLVFAFLFLKYSPFSNFLNKEAIENWLTQFGVWAPIVFILTYSVAITILVPATLMTAVGAILFGPYWGFVYNLLGAIIGATISFWIGRFFGRGFIKDIIGKKLANWDDKLGKHGFSTILYLRLIYFPYSALNLGAGLTKIKFMDYFWGTLLGTVVGGFVLTFFFGKISEIVLQKDWENLFRFDILFAIGLFVGSFFIPLLIKRFKKYFLKDKRG
ncbi:MAG TPA: TVP38/TMEM64 family protein [Bdellovibrionota bacterium]|nr:TVP38/TMEM64 family protein [Bdellovibrionota bacterium]